MIKRESHHLFPRQFRDSGFEDHVHTNLQKNAKRHHTWKERCHFPIGSLAFQDVKHEVPRVGRMVRVTRRHQFKMRCEMKNLLLAFAVFAFLATPVVFAEDTAPTGGETTTTEAPAQTTTDTTTTTTTEKKAKKGKRAKKKSKSTTETTTETAPVEAAPQE